MDVTALDAGVARVPPFAYASREARKGARMAIDPDFASVAGVVVGQVAGVLAVWYVWGGFLFSPSILVIIAIFVVAAVGAVSFGYVARKAAQIWLK